MALHTDSQDWRFCGVVLGVAMALLGAIALFNAVVDPYAMYRWVEIEGFNALKPAIYHRVRLLKAYEVRRVQPQSLVLGTSRSHLGIRPSHEGWKQDTARRYNLAFDGATTKEMYFYLRHAYAVCPVKQVLLGLDSYHPTAAPATVRPDFDPLVLYKPGLPQWVRWITGDLRLLVSLDTLRASLDTLRTQHSAEPEWLARDGQRLGEVFFRRPGESFTRQGPRAYFDEVDHSEVGFKLDWLLPQRDKSAASHPAPADETSLGYIRRIVQFCRDYNIDLRIFISPAHAHQLELAALTGEWPAMENAKRALVQLLAEDAERHPDKPSIPLWDFSGYSSITTERLPPRNSPAEMMYYWDSSHFKSIVGDFILDRLFGVQDSQHPVPKGFGVQLTVANIEPILAAMRDGRAAWQASHFEEASALRDSVEEWLRTNQHGRSLLAIQ